MINQSFEWAMFHLSQGRAVRRASWPVKHVANMRHNSWPITFGPGVAVWHVWLQSDAGDDRSKCPWAHACKGWGGQIGADDPQTLPVIGADGTMYRPTEGDTLADDWEFYEAGLDRPDNMGLWPEIIRPRQPSPDEDSPAKVGLAALGFIGIPSFFICALIVWLRS